MAAPNPPQTKLDWALHHAAKGFHVFRVKVDGKEPARKGWQAEATTDPAKIRALWADGDWNIGIYAGRFGDDGGALLVVDVDNKNEKRGDEELVRLEMKGCDLPDTLETATPTGGRHLFYLVDAPVTQGANVLGKGLDTRSRGGYVVGPGSTIGGKPYTVGADRPIQRAPQWLIDRCGKPPERKPAAATINKSDPARALRRGLEYSTGPAPIAVEGDGGEATTCDVIRRMHDIGVSVDECLDILNEHWNPRCVPPWDLGELRKKVISVYKSCQDPIGDADPAADFGPIETSDKDDWLKALNTRFSVTRHHNATMVHEHVVDPELGYRRNQWSPFDDFKRRHMKTRVGRRDLGTAWLEHPDRREYESEAYLPGGDAPPGVLNTWTGYQVAPRAGCWDRNRAHWHEIICNGDDAVFLYVMAWVAMTFQRPREQGHVALAMKGGEGVGKGSLALPILRLQGPHGLHNTQPKHLIGNFNAHLGNVSVVFADEAFFAGDPSHRGPLFTLITENTVQIEAKGVDAKTVRNMLHIIMATNHDWLVPAGVDARRFCVLQVSDARRGDTEYFRALRAEMDDGGLAAMLHDLLAYDLSDFNVFDIPQTAALAAQKTMSLQGRARWIFDCLQRGYIGTQEWTDEGLSIGKDDAHGCYKLAAREAREYAPKDLSTWARLTKAVMGDTWTESKLWAGGARRRHLRLAGITAARGAFERHIGQPLEWETDAEAVPMFSRGGSNA